jgi:3-hydroxybutyryl-CoA dehydrogenase
MVCRCRFSGWSSYWKRRIKLNIFAIEWCLFSRYHLATNTSSISITQIGAVVAHPERVIGMHFMNPVPIMKLVEIIRGTIVLKWQNHHDTLRETGKTPVEVNDYPGFALIEFWCRWLMKQSKHYTTK